MRRRGDQLPYPLGPQLDRVDAAHQEFTAGERHPVAEPVADVPCQGRPGGHDADELAALQPHRLVVAGRMPEQRRGDGVGRLLGPAVPGARDGADQGGSLMRSLSRRAEARLWIQLEAKVPTWASEPWRYWARPRTVTS